MKFYNIGRGEKMSLKIRNHRNFKILHIFSSLSKNEERFKNLVTLLAYFSTAYCRGLYHKTFYSRN